MEVHQTIVVRNERHGLDMEDVLAAHLRKDASALSKLNRLVLGCIEAKFCK